MILTTYALIAVVAALTSLVWLTPVIGFMLAAIVTPFISSAVVAAAAWWIAHDP